MMTSSYHVSCFVTIRPKHTRRQRSRADLVLHLGRVCYYRHAVEQSDEIQQWNHRDTNAERVINVKRPAPDAIN